MENTITRDIEQSAFDRWMETGKHPELIRINPDLKNRAEAETPQRFDGDCVCGWKYIEDASVEQYVIE